MARGRVHARAVAGAVVIEVDPATAEDLAHAFAAAYASSDELGVARPDWANDVVSLITAATRARVQLGVVPEPVNVPLLRMVPRGESA